MAKIYVASSWRNRAQPHVVKTLRHLGHQVYDFRNPSPGNHGFQWSEIDPAWQRWRAKQYRDALSHPVAQAGFASDFSAMHWADTFVGVMPFGRSASLEMGWGAGRGKRTVLLLSDGEPELMVKMLGHVCVNLEEVCEILEAKRVAA